MSERTEIKYDKTVLDCLDPHVLSDFYINLLGWRKGYDRDGFVIIGAPDGSADLGFQENEDYVPPVWPEESGKQQQMLHLDFAVKREELSAWVDYAVQLGAKVADTQYSEHYTVMLDPSGHPFCLDAT